MSNRWTGREARGTLSGMGDKPGKYWDHRECRWVRCPTPAPDQAVVPAQPQAADADGATVVGTAN